MREDMPEKFVVIIPWPPKALSPNGRANRFEAQRAKSAYRDLCYVKIHNVYVAQWPCRPKWKSAACSIRALCGKARRGKNRGDRDNLVASLKVAIDGLQKAGIVENDSGLAYPAVDFIETKAKESLIELTVWPT